jgi:hypothetical protein
MKLFAATVAAALALAGCGLPIGGAAPAHINKTVDGIDYVVLTNGFGGNVNQKNAYYKKLGSTGKQVVIDGVMMSMDAFGAFSVPGACYTANAVFSPHATSILGIIPTYGTTKRLTKALPAPLRDWFSNSGWRWQWVVWPSIHYAQLREMWPEGACHHSIKAKLRPDGWGYGFSKDTRYHGNEFVGG